MTLQLKNYDPALMYGGADDLTVAQTIQNSGSGAFAVGPNGATNPAFNVDASTASGDVGLNVKVGAAGSSPVALSAITSATNDSMTIDAAGSGTIKLAGTSTGNVIVGANKLTVAPASGNTTIAGTLAVTGAVTHTSTTLCSDTVTIASAKGITGAGTGSNGILITNPKNTTNATVSGTPVTVQVTIGSTPYYFLVYPTSTT